MEKNNDEQRRLDRNTIRREVTRNPKLDDNRRPPRRDFDDRRPPREPRRDFDDRRPPRPKRPPMRGPQFKQITKLFQDNKDMIEYVNEKGADGHQIDIFKIDDNLYKVVVIEKIEIDPRKELDNE